MKEPKLITSLTLSLGLVEALDRISRETGHSRSSLARVVLTEFVKDRIAGSTPPGDMARAAQHRASPVAPADTTGLLLPECRSAAT